MSVKQSLRDYEALLYVAPSRIVADGQKSRSDAPHPRMPTRSSNLLLISLVNVLPKSARIFEDEMR